MERNVMSDMNTDKELNSIDNENEDLNSEKTSSKKVKKNFFKEFADYIEMFALAVCFVVLIFTFLFRVCTVDGASMNNTLSHGEKIIISDLFYTPERNDIVVFYENDTLNRPVVKRVIATEGEKVRIDYFEDTMLVTVTSTDGEKTVLEENFILYNYQKYYATENYTVPENHVFVMGDNRNDSRDSRDPSIGFVDERTILGKAVFRVTPISDAGSIK